MKKTQYGSVFFIVIAALNVFIIYRNHDDFWTVAGFALLSLVVLMLFYKLTIQADDQQVKFSLGIGLIRGKYKYEDIISCRPLSYIPFGWGVRFRPGAILFNVSGNKAIELNLRNKSRMVWIGTKVPEEVSAFVNEQLEKRKKG